MSDGTKPQPPLERRVSDFADRDIPVLARSIRSLAALKRLEDSVDPREISRVVLRDPMLTLRVLIHLQTNRARRRLEDITTVEHAIMMLGVQRFFATFEALPAVEEVLKDRPEALSGLMRVIRRSMTAAVFAQSWAVVRVDIESDEVVVATLLHDMAEMLLWCFAPDAAGAIESRLHAVPGARSNDAQQQILGFTLLEMQLALVKRWGLPALFAELMDDAHSGKPRVRNVSTAIAISRHSAHGWNNPALPHDVANVARLLNQPHGVVVAGIFNAALRAIAEREWYGETIGPDHLPRLPLQLQPASSGSAEPSAELLAAAGGWLARIARGLPADGQGRKAMLEDTTHDMLTAVAAALDGMARGLGFGAACFMVADAAANRVTLRFVSGDEPEAPAWLEQDADAGMAVARAFADGTALTHVGRPVAGRARGMFAVPISARGRIRALAVAVHPADLKSLAAENFGRFRALGAGLGAALDGIGATPFWVRADHPPSSTRV